MNKYANNCVYREIMPGWSECKHANTGTGWSTKWISEGEMTVAGVPARILRAEKDAWVEAHPELHHMCHHEHTFRFCDWWRENNAG